MEHQPFPPGSTQPPQSKFPWPLIAFGLAAALLIVIFWMVPRTNTAATRAMNNSLEPAAHVRISGVKISPQKTDQAANVVVYGEATNTGTLPVTQAIVSAVFRDKNGNPLAAQQQPIERADAKGEKVEEARNLAQQPLKPGQTTGFRVNYAQVPGNWDGKPPELTVLQVTLQK
jgi:lipopolysaccharide export LptBFGC system permease protein LptF